MDVVFCLAKSWYLGSESLYRLKHALICCIYHSVLKHFFVHASVIFPYFKYIFFIIIVLKIEIVSEIFQGIGLIRIVSRIENHRIS